MLSPTGDVSIFKDKPWDSNPGVGNFGGLTADGLCVYDIAWGEPRSTQRTLMQFDVSAFGSGSVQSAVLHLTVGGGGLGGHVLVYRVTQPWVEGTGTTGNTTDGADWFTYDGTNAWASAGGDYDSGTLIADTMVQLGDLPGRFTWDVTSLVQAWVNGTASNYGLVLVSGTPVDDWTGGGGNTSLYDISSRQASSEQPYLEVTAIPEPCTMLLLSGGLIGLAGRCQRVRR
jgi:hypothetical protein